MNNFKEVIATVEKQLDEFLISNNKVTDIYEDKITSVLKLKDLKNQANNIAFDLITQLENIKNNIEAIEIKTRGVNITYDEFYIFKSSLMFDCLYDIVTTNHSIDSLVDVNKYGNVELLNLVKDEYKFMLLYNLILDYRDLVPFSIVAKLATNHDIINGFINEISLLEITKNIAPIIYSNLEELIQAFDKEIIDYTKAEVEKFEKYDSINDYISNKLIEEKTKIIEEFGITKQEDIEQIENLVIEYLKMTEYSKENIDNLNIEDEYVYQELKKLLK